VGHASKLGDPSGRSFSQEGAHVARLDDGVGRAGRGRDVDDDQVVLCELAEALGRRRVRTVHFSPLIIATAGRTTPNLPFCSFVAMD
jgi:hypothetical protein